MATKKAMLTAKYDMKMLKQIVEIDEGMKVALCNLVGVDDEDGLPEDIQNLDLQDFLGPKINAKEELFTIFVNSLNCDPKDLDALATDVSKRIQGLLPDTN